MLLRLGFPLGRLLLGLLSAFLVLSLADLFLTWKLLQRGDERILESNPVAARCLASYGWGGITAFKLGLVVLVAVLAGCVARWRPRTGESILIFGCGAVSTVVLHSVFLGWFASKPTAGPADEEFLQSWEILRETNLFHLLTKRDVQEELQLSETQVRGITEFVEERNKRLRNRQEFNREQWNAAVEEIAALQQILTDNLEPAQMERLQQLALQQRGAVAFSDPEVSKTLLLTVDQKQTIRTLLSTTHTATPLVPSYRGPRQDWGRRTENDADRLMNRLEEVLAADQLIKWKEMIGKPFKGSPRPATMPAPSFRRDPRPRNPER